VAAGQSDLADLDGEAVAALVRDGLVSVSGGRARLPE
jgi:hypothetical protein